MVRVISQGFSTPRSRHSSGEEMIDRFAAMKALSALSDDEKHSRDEFAPKTLVIDCSTDTNDSFSGLDSEEEGGVFKKDAENNNLHVYQDPAAMKKERRRARNKVSAQHYRQRRRQQSSAADKMLESLETHHKSLLERVRQLEAEKHIVEEYLRSCVRVPWCPYHEPVSPANPAARSCCNTPPTIPEDGPIQQPICHPCSGHASDNHQSVPVNMAVDNMAVDNNNANINSNNNSNNMPLSMSGVALTTNGSSVS